MKIYMEEFGYSNIDIVFEDVIQNDEVYRLDRAGVPAAVVMSWDQYSKLLNGLVDEKHD